MHKRGPLACQRLDTFLRSHRRYYDIIRQYLGSWEGECVTHGRRNP